MRRASLLTFVEVAVVAAWIVLAGISLTRSTDDSGTLIPIDVDALVTGTMSEEWMGIYVEDQKVGYAFTGTARTVEGGKLIQSRSAYRMMLFGELREIVQAGVAVVDGEGRLQRFDVLVQSAAANLAARGEVRGDTLMLEVLQAGEASTIEIDIDEPPQIGLTLADHLARASENDLKEGQVFEVPYFSPTMLAKSNMTVRVIGTEILPDGNEAFWVERDFEGIVSRTLINRGGDTLREEMSGGGLPIWSVRETREQAVKMPDDQEPVDFIALSAVPLKGYLKNPRERMSLSLAVTGVGLDRIFSQPPLQTLTDDRVIISVPMKAELPSPEVADSSPAMAEFLVATPFMPVDHRDIQAQSAKTLGGIGDRKEAVQALVDWTYKYLEKTPVVGVPNALEVLQVGKGDCNEHTSLFVALARAGGIPARIAAGLVYSDRVSNTGAFYYHAWPEVWFGEETGWVPVDPTFGQFPADATHVKIVEGDLARQIELMGVMGRIGFELIKDETPEGSAGSQPE